MTNSLYLLLGFSILPILFFLFWLFIKITLSLRKIINAILFDIQFVARFWRNVFDYFKVKNER